MQCQLTLSHKILTQVKQLYTFLLGISIEWDLDDIQLADSSIICRNYLNKYYKTIKDQSMAANWTFIACLPLWAERHSLCPIIYEFNMKALADASDSTICLLLPQLIQTVITTRDTSTFESILQRIKNDHDGTFNLFWILMTELDLCSDDKRFLTMIMYKFLSCTPYRKSLKLQGVLVEKLVKLSTAISSERCSFAERRQLFKKLITSPTVGLDLFEPVSWPLDPRLSVTAIIAEECTLFHSQLCPMLLTFLTTCGQAVKCIFKFGDDLRQDALIMQMTKCIQVTLGDLLPIHRDNIVSYRVLPTGANHGFIEYVPSSCLEDLIPKTRKETNWIPSDGKTPFLQSCAFYSVLTFIMCVGDRHLDNILVTQNHRFFHIDYSFLGREPKPFAPPVKLCPEILTLFGGYDGAEYNRFLNTCVEILQVLQGTTWLWLQQFSLSVDAGMTDVNNTVLNKIQQRLSTNCVDFKALLAKSFDSRLPQVMDNFHRTWKVINGGRVTDTVDEDWYNIDLLSCNNLDA